METIGPTHRLLEHFDWVEIACAQNHSGSVPGRLMLLNHQDVIRSFVAVFMKEI